MCGIVGYIGHREAWPIVLSGLERLEYRGYDSAGIAILTPSNQLEFRKSVGKVRELGLSLNSDYPKGHLGVGHTRWATHGRPTTANAHPHTDCHQQVTVVHNGIVENYLELKRELMAQGHIFASETDSEVIAHLLEDQLQRGQPFEEAFSRLSTLLEGAQAIVALWPEEPHKLLALRLGNAGGIVMARGEGETILGSDLPAVLPLANQVSFLEDGEMAIVTQDSVQIVTSSGRKMTPKARLISLESSDVSKEGYPHFMLKEMMEQPQAVSSALRGRVNFDEGRVELEDFPLSISQIQALKRVILVGCGTSFHAAIVGRHLIEALAGIPAEAESSSEFRYRDPIMDSNTLVIAIAQSGETADTLAAMKAVREKGGRLLTICNLEGSQATRMAEATLYMGAGLEVGVASTKTFISSLTILCLVAIYLAQARGTVSKDAQAKIIRDLARVPNLLGQILSDHRPYKKLARSFARYSHLLYLGRGITYPVAAEGAWKMQEISYIPAEGNPAGEMKHGPIALIGSGMAVVAVVPQTSLYSKMVNNIKEVKARNGVVLAIATEEDQALASQVDHVIYIPACPELLTPLLATVPLQLLAYYVAVQRGCDVDQPRNLAKSVTVE